MKLYDSEMKIMELIWEHEPVSAKELSLIAQDEIGWNKNTTYTVIKKAIGKGYVKREDPDFICTSLISKEEVRGIETRSLVDRLFGGSKKALFSALLEDEDLTEKDIAELREMIEKR
ncbi:MAG: BlaI/MecI/CopY family transcriptional regulator [Clostridia bacterium]|nr:BlaI/MecI/CopY family transcriptional regulator [Clostridia bacterium]MBR3640378.1 BlaI/MecI/CopY family transcriptional regulator [Clostridia bacterium]